MSKTSTTSILIERKKKKTIWGLRDEIFSRRSSVSLTSELQEGNAYRRYQEWEADKVVMVPDLRGILPGFPRCRYKRVGPD